MTTFNFIPTKVKGKNTFRLLGCRRASSLVPPSIVVHEVFCASELWILTGCKNVLLSLQMPPFPVMFCKIYSCNFNCSFPQTWHMCNMQCRYALNIVHILYTIADLHLLILVSLGSLFAYVVQETYKQLSNDSDSL